MNLAKLTPYHNIKTSNAAQESELAIFPVSKQVGKNKYQCVVSPLGLSKLVIIKAKALTTDFKNRSKLLNFTPIFKLN